MSSPAKSVARLMEYEPLSEVAEVAQNHLDRGRAAFRLLLELGIAAGLVIAPVLLTSFVRADGGGSDEDGLASGLSDVPLPLIVLGLMSLALLIAGGLGYLARRRADATPPTPPDSEP